jgi:hypothetical protein
VMKRPTFFALLAVSVGLAFAARAAACGVERWQVKTLTDVSARQVNFHAQPDTIAHLVSLPVPKPLTAARTYGELRTVMVRVSLLAFKLEGDGDVHLVVADPTNPGATMIAEFPDLACTHGAQHRWAMELAKRYLLAAEGAPARSQFTNLSGTATITGVVFFDFQHGQRGVAPNAVELHPVVGFRLVNG